MTEIPEHLLKRSKAAKAKASGDAASGDAPAGDNSSNVAAVPAIVPAAAAPAPVAPVGPPPPKPDIAVVAAYKRRKKIPVWAMMTLAILPLWAFMYVRALTPASATVAGPLGVGAELYGGCAGCHGGSGEGGVGYAFAEGEVLKTFPYIEDQLRFVYAGTTAYEAAGITSYGDPKRPGGPHITKVKGIMPGQGSLVGGSLTEAEILGVVCHERYTLGGADATGSYAAEYDEWCSPASEIIHELESGAITFDTLSEKVEGALVVGTKPLAGSPTK